MAAAFKILPLCFVYFSLLSPVQLRRPKPKGSPFYFVSPNTIRLGEQETIAVAHDNTQKQRVNIYLQDHPQKRNKISNVEFEVSPDKPEVVRVMVRPQDLPNAVYTNPHMKNYVALVVDSENFHKEVILPITTNTGYVFIQTDKPIYTPKQRVNIRVIPLNEGTRPSREAFKVQIRNPQNVVVKEETFNKRQGPHLKAFISHVYTFPPDTMLGEWSVVALYGTEFQHNATVTFEVAEYVLPTFSLKLLSPEVILPHEDMISGTVTAKYVYGKNVEGHVTFKYGVKGESGKVVFFGRSGPIELLDGFADFRLSTDDLKNHKDIGWFPQISGSTFVVEATVRDFASGNEEVVMDQNAKFSESPFTISFKRCLKDFKPGLVSVVEADVTYVNGKPAEGIRATITAVANGRDVLNINSAEKVSDEEGRLTFLIHPEVQHESVIVTVRTDDERFGANQAVASHTQMKYESDNRGYLAISRRSGKSIRPFSVFAEDIYIEPPEISDVYYMVISKGLILFMNKLPKGNFKNQKVEFQVTHEMVPSFRLLVFAHHKEELIADSLKVDVEDQCAPNAEVTIVPAFPSSDPGSEGKIVLTGHENTLVGLLGVDEAVYSLRNKDLLTKSKLFNAMEYHDLGCGPGGGRSTLIVLGNAGVVIMTSLFAPQSQVTVPPCAEKNRKKREIVEEMSQNYTGRDKECCELGMMKHHSGLSCYDRAEVIERHLRDDCTDNCSAAFLDCCTRNEDRITSLKNGVAAGDGRERVGVAIVDELEFVEVKDEDFYEKDLVVRKDFRETWIFEDKIMGVDRIEQVRATLPHSITTWVIQAVSVSERWGMCVSEPKKVVSFKNVFLQLNLPYSVVRNEQVEIQAVVFNYGAKRLPVIVYMYGVQDICSGTQQGEKSERKRVYVEPQSANTVTFPIIPLKTGEYNIKVVALSPEGSDVIIRKLNVVPEGYTVERNIVVKLDPSNQQKRKKRNVETECYNDAIDEKRKVQLTAIKLDVPLDFIPGTETCVISALGDEFGPTVETSLQDPDKLLLLPRGCGEQTMMFLGPTLYTMKYLKVTGKITAESEEKGYGFIREGYQRELIYRKTDGSYAAFTHRPASVWLTAFVVKVFCQANTLVQIDREVMCSGVKWLVQQRQADGSYIDHHPVVHWDMTGGVTGTLPMTSFVLIALLECSCNVDRLHEAKSQATLYLEDHIADLKEPLPIAIAAYALALADSQLKNDALARLQMIEKYNEELNTLHWETGKGTQDIEVTSYGLLVYLQYNDMEKANAIVNWLNTKRLASGSFPSTQDTVIALQALSEYAIQARNPGINLVSNITSSNDRRLQRSLQFRENNALIQQYVKIDKVGGLVFVNTEGHGVGLLSVKLKYNIPKPPEKLCKFDIKINVTEVKAKPDVKQPNVPLQPGNNDVFQFLDNDLIRAVGVGEGALKEDEIRLEVDPRARPAQDRAAPVGVPEVLKDHAQRKKREDKEENSALVLNLQVCIKYLGNNPAGMTIVDAGIFSGFEPVKEDLDNLVKNRNNLVDKCETSSRSVVFYLDQGPTHEYCFDFRVKRQYIVGNTQTSVVRVYDYYNPDESCTQFYSPDQSSPMLRKICSNGICQCAEGGCPLKKPFAAVRETYDLDGAAEDKVEAARTELGRIACNENDYVWRGIVTKREAKAGFLYITFRIVTVIKEGIEKRDELLEEERVLMARDNCESADLELNSAYVIMGKDGEQYMDENENSWYRYLMDRTSSVYKWRDSPKRRVEKFLQSIFKWLDRVFPTQGCLE